MKPQGYHLGKPSKYTPADEEAVCIDVRCSPFSAPGLRISEDGTTAIFIRGTAAKREGWVANPRANPDGPERAVWAVRTTGNAPAWRVVRDAVTPELAPDGSSLLFVKDGQIYRARVTPVHATSERDRGEKAAAGPGAQRDDASIASSAFCVCSRFSA